MQKKVTVVLLSLLSLVMAFSLTAGMAIDVLANSTTTDQQYVSQREQMELEILTGTLGEPIGMQGFEGKYAINSPDEMVEIIVQFATPPAGALQLIQERGISLGRTLPGTCYYEQALVAHDLFKEQLAEISTPFGSDAIEITSQNYWLFNGAFMRAPGAMVELIAQLPEVYAVFPDVALYTESSYAAAMQDCPFFVNPDAFMRQTREYLNMDYINNEMGITGDGVIVAVLDSGIDHSHPEFRRFLDPNLGGTNGRIRGYNWPIRTGGIHDNSFETNTNIAQPGMRSHGTTVSGAVIGIAPGIELWNFRVGTTRSGITGLSLYQGLEEAVRAGAQVVTISIGGIGAYSFATSAINIATLHGVVVITIAGNDGQHGSYTLWSPGTAPLAISVGAGTPGGQEHPGWDYGDSVRRGSSLGPVSHTHHIKPDIIAPTGLMTTYLRGRYTGGESGINYSHGTSHAAPVIAGVAALLIEAFPNDTPYEIKARIMNSARPMTGRGGDSVFSTGAGFVQPLAALRSDTIVTVEHDVDLGVFSYRAPENARIRMASLSFGGIDASNPDGTMPIFIENRSNTSRTYTISHYFQNNRDGAAHISLSTNSITVAANSTGQLYASMFFNGDVRTGFYDGYVYVRDGATVVARLPFAGVVTERFYSNTIIAQGTLGTGGAPWTLLENGTVTVGGGRIMSDFLTVTPWMNYRTQITKIIFTQPITVENILVALFFSLSSLETIEGLEYLDTSNATHMGLMFWDTQSLTSLDLSNFNTSNVVDMQSMFFGTHSLTSLDLSSFDTSNVTMMQGMFSGARSLTSLDLSNFDTSNVTMMTGMFMDTHSLTSLDVSSFNTSKVPSMHSMFRGARSLTSLDLSNFDTRNFEINGMNQMFEGASSLRYLNLSSFDNSHHVNPRMPMSLMFSGTTNLRHITLGANFRFSGSPQLPSVPTNSTYTGRWQNIGTGTAGNPLGQFVLASHQLVSTFNGATMADTFVWQPVNRESAIIAQGTLGTGGAPWTLGENGTVTVGAGRIMSDFPTVTPWFFNYRDQITKVIFTYPITVEGNLSGLFLMQNYLETIEGLDYLDTSNATDMSFMFWGTHSLTSVDVSNFDTRNVTNMHGMFWDTHSLTSLDVSSFDTSNVTTMVSMFAGTHNLTSLDMSNFDTGNVTGMQSMFSDARSLISLDLSSFDIRNLGVHGLNTMFSGASNLRYLDLSSFDTRHHTSPRMSTTAMFQGATSLRHLTLGANIQFSNNTMLPLIPTNSTYTGFWQNIGTGTAGNPLGQFVLTSWYLMSNYNGATMADTFVWQPVNRESAIIAQGTLGTGGAPWTLLENGTVTVGEGRIMHDFLWVTPWHNYYDQITKITFTNPITVENTLQALFAALRSLETIEGLEYLDTSNATDMNGMFFDLPSLTSLDLSNFDTSNVTCMHAMFVSTYSLTSLDLSSFDTSNVTNMSSMFNNTHSLASLDLSSFDTSNVAFMHGMFTNAHSLTSLDLSNFDTSNVMSMERMFSGAHSLTSLDLSSFDTRNIAIGGMAFMFQGTTSLRQLTLGVNLQFAGGLQLPQVPTNNIYTGHWQNIGTGTASNPSGQFVLTSQQLMDTYNGATMADTFVWQPVNREPAIIAQGTLGTDGAPWTLRENGTVTVSAGRIMHDFLWVTPWHNYYDQITKITFTNPITVENTLQALFAALRSLETIEGLGHLDTSTATDMNGMFFDLPSLTSLDLSNFDTSNVTCMHAMFLGAYNLTSLDLSSFDTSNVTNMSSMFVDTHGLTSLDLSSFDTSNVRYMNFMFHCMHSLTNLNVSSFNTSNVAFMTGMFTNTHSLTSLDLSNFDTSNVMSMERMFSGAHSLTNLDLSSFDTRSLGIGGMDLMFQGTTSLRNLTLGANFRFMGSPELPTIPANSTYTGHWQNIGTGTASNPLGQFVLTSQQLMDTYNGTTMADTFVWQPVSVEQPIIAQGTLGTGGALWTLREDGTVTVGQGRIMSDFLTVTPWRGYHSQITKIIFTHPVTVENTLSGLFMSLSSLETIEGLEYLDTSNATDMSAMFFAAQSLTSIDLSNFNTYNVTDMNSMFRETLNLASLDLSSFSTRNVTNMNAMFFGTMSLRDLDISHFDTNNVTDMGSMFHDARSLTNLSSFDTPNVTNMSFMFAGTHNLVNFDISTFNTRNVTNMQSMFSESRSLTSLDLSRFDASNVRPNGMDFMFQNAYSLEYLSLPRFDADHGITEVSMTGAFQGATSLRHLFLGGSVQSIAHTQLPPVPANSAYTGYWQNIGIDGSASNPSGQFVLTSQQLMDTFHGETMSCTFVWQPVFAGLDDIAGGTLGTGGAPWTLLENGTIIVGEGRIMSDFFTVTPWHGYRDQITEIIFTRPITVENTLASLFRDLHSVEIIEGLEHLDTSNATDMNAMFWNAHSLTSLDLSNFDTSNVINMAGMFSVARSLTNLDLSSFDTRNVIEIQGMAGMFQNASSLEYLNLSSFDTSHGSGWNHMWDMFQGANNLRQLTLGANLRFLGYVQLSPVPTNSTYTGHWQNIGAGTASNPLGQFVLTSQQLTDTFNGPTMADTFVWQPISPEQPIPVEQTISGSGTTASPFIVSNLDQFLFIASAMEANGQVNGVSALNASFSLNANLDLSNQEMFFGLASQARPFRGEFDGNNHTVTLNINDTTQNRVGLFRVANGATIQNVIVEGNVTGSHAVGGIAGEARGGTTITNVENYASITANNDRAGGVVGLMNTATIINATNKGTVETLTQSHTGGIVGQAWAGSIISDVTNYASITGGRGNVGGIAGLLCRTTVTNATNNGAVIGAINNIGGIAGGMQNSAVVSDSISTGNITGELRVGGIVGTLTASSSVIDSKVSADAIIQGDENTGGVAGSMSSSTINYVEMHASVNGDFQTGGIAGRASTSSQITNSTVYGNVTGNNTTGSVVGDLINRSAVTNTFAKGVQVYGTNGANLFVGTLAANATIENSGYYILGSITPAAATILIDGLPHDESLITRYADGSFAVLIPVSSMSGSTQAINNKISTITFIYYGYDAVHIDLSENNEHLRFNLNVGHINLTGNDAAPMDLILDDESEYQDYDDYPEDSEYENYPKYPEYEECEQYYNEKEEAYSDDSQITPEYIL